MTRKFWLDESSFILLFSSSSPADITLHRALQIDILNFQEVLIDQTYSFNAYMDVYIWFFMKISSFEIFLII